MSSWPPPAPPRPAPSRSSPSAAPQLTRRLTRSPGAGVLVSACGGALLLVAADLAAQRLFAPTQIPVGAATGALGGLYLVWLLAHESTS
ncbi:iron chelate uptake ABC transporter family permease subunit, partial [Candidatus Frankia nodulisporulans]